MAAQTRIGPIILKLSRKMLLKWRYGWNQTGWDTLQILLQKLLWQISRMWFRMKNERVWTMRLMDLIRKLLQKIYSQKVIRTAGLLLERWKISPVLQLKTLKPFIRNSMRQIMLLLLSPETLTRKMLRLW